MITSESVVFKAQFKDFFCFTENLMFCSQEDNFFTTIPTISKVVTS